MLAAVIAFLFLFRASAIHPSFVFTGGIARGDQFSKTLLDGLVFELTPQDCGWMINIRPPDKNNEDYVWPENPPIHAKNVLYLDDSYDGDWETPLKSPHLVHFARNRQQAARMLQWIDAFDHGDYARAHKLDLPDSALGKAVFTVTSYKKLHVGKKEISGAKDDYCATDVRFRVQVSNY